MYHVYLVTHYIVCGVAELWQRSWLSTISHSI